MPTTVNPTDPRVKRTRQLLLRAFLDVLMSKNFRDITIQDITDRATVNRGTFYDHFADKDEILEQCLREQFRQHLATRLPAASTMSSASLDILIRAVIDFLIVVRHDCRPADREFEPICQQVIIDEIQLILGHWFKQSGIAAQLPATSIANTVVAWSWSIFGVASQWQQQSEKQPAQHMTEQLTRLLLSSVALRA